jgi:RecB family exonuclease
MLLDLFEEEWKQLGDGAVPPDLRKLFAHEQGVLQLFLDTMQYIEDQHGNLLNEFVLEDAEKRPVLLGHDQRGRPVFLTGRIDRIDVHRDDAGRAIILDYKTGQATTAAERRAKIEDGRMLQLPLYASALRLVRRDLDVVGGAYVYLNERAAEPKKALGLAGDWITPGDKPTGVPFDAEAARLKALELAEQMRAGDFSLTRHAEEECTPFCALRHACRQENGSGMS